MKPRAFWVRYAIFSGLKSNLAGGFKSKSMYTRFLPPSAVLTACVRLTSVQRSATYAAAHLDELSPLERLQDTRNSCLLNVAPDLQVANPDAIHTRLLDQLINKSVLGREALESKPSQSQESARADAHLLACSAFTVENVMPLSL